MDEFNANSYFAGSLTALGKENLIVALSVLKKHVPQFQLVCDWMEKYIYEPVTGRCGILPVKDEVLSAAVESGAKSLLDVLSLAGDDVKVADE